MNKKDQARLRRAKKTRLHIQRLEKTRLCVSRSNCHISAQLTSPLGDKTIVTASTLEKDFRDKNKSCGNKKAAAEVGKMIAEKALALGIKVVAFDRSGYKYHGRVRALADAAREGGLEF